MELQRQQFFHASKRHDLQPGVDQILPANDERVGGSNYGYSRHDKWGGGWGEEDRGDFTFAADSEREAEAWEPSASRGRPVTYVVDPGDDYEVETHHAMHHGATHAKKRGPMDIVDRIDIPMPRHDTPEQVVQGTFGGLNWGQFNGLPKDYTGPATVGEQHPETDNFKRINPPHERMMAQAAINNAHANAEDERVGYARKWKQAGQQELWKQAGQQELF